MSTSFLYHALGATAHQYLKTEYGHGRIVFHLAKKREKQRCINCKSRDVTRQGGRTYRVRTVPIGQMPVWICLHLNKLACRSCGTLRQESRDLADPRKSYTRKLARLVLDLAEKMTLQDVASFLQMGWHQVRDIVRNDLERKEAKRSWRSVRWLAVDEIATRKGHRYMTVVVDLESGMVLDAIDGRSATSLQPVLRRMKRAGADIQAVAVDMSPAYRRAIQSELPQAVVVHDPFHVVQAVNRALDQARRQEQKRLNEEGRSTLKGHRFLLLKGWEKIEKDETAIGKLETLFDLNENLYRAYLLKEDLRLLWKQDSKIEAEFFLDAWLEEAAQSNLGPFQRLALTLSRHKTDLLTWYDHRITTGPLEGLNNKIKVLKRRAYGYRNQGFFRLLILFIHKTRFHLSGV